MKIKINLIILSLVLVLITPSFSSECRSNFFRENIKLKGFALETERTTIIPLTLSDYEHVEDTYNENSTPFLQMEAFNSPESIAEYKAQQIAYENMSLEDRKKLKIYDYSIIFFEESKPYFAGLYRIFSPDPEGWSETMFIIKEKYRNKKIGEEVKKSIYDNIVINLIGKKVKVIKYEADYDKPTALLVRSPSNPNKVIINKNAKAYLEDSKVEFRGLKGWVHEDNKASIKLQSKCGWIQYGYKIQNDLKGIPKKHFLYRSPNPSGENKS